MPGAYSPYMPPMNPNVMPGNPFDQLINAYGIRVMWMKSHNCPCTYGGEIPGSPDMGCTQCHGRGTYWNEPLGPFQVFLTYSQMAGSRSIDDPGSRMDTTHGAIQQADPVLTIPAYIPEGLLGSSFVIGSSALGVSSGQSQSILFENASLYDAYVELDATMRFNCVLEVGGQVYLPYQYGAVVAPSGAVTVYDQATRTVSVVPSSQYTFYNGAVLLSGYPQGTAYIVEYTAAPTYVSWKPAGSFPHVRPFGANTVSLPKRFQLQMLDLWTRARTQGGGI